MLQKFGVRSHKTVPACNRCWTLPQEGVMKVFTLDGDLGHVVHGATVRGSDGLLLGAGPCGARVPLFRNNPADVRRSGDVFEAHPVQVQSGWALAKPSHPQEDTKVLVVVRSQSASGGEQQGCWSFDLHARPRFDSLNQILATGTGPRRFFEKHGVVGNIGWHDALIVMEVGQVIWVTNQSGRKTCARYESIEKGLVLI